jgi:ATP-dependent RNA helicase DDX52/ROK1
MTETFKIKQLDYLVIDEADKLCEMGFLEQLESILKNCEGINPAKFLFSATMQPGIEEHVRQSIMGEKVLKIQIGIRNTTATAVDQSIIYVGKEDGKLQTLRQYIRAGFEPPMLVFVQSKDRAKELYHELIYEGVNANVIHADRKKHERDAIMKDFRLGKIWVLICTDLMSRGVDFKTVNCVVNYDFP